MEKDKYKQEGSIKIRELSATIFGSSIEFVHGCCTSGWMRDIDELKAGMAQLEKHIEAQDLEVYRQQRLIDALQKQLKKIEERVASLEQSGGSANMPADEKPPHY